MHEDDQAIALTNGVVMLGAGTASKFSFQNSRASAEAGEFKPSDIPSHTVRDTVHDLGEFRSIGGRSPEAFPAPAGQGDGPVICPTRCGAQRPLRLQRTPHGLRLPSLRRSQRKSK